MPASNSVYTRLRTSHWQLADRIWAPTIGSVSAAKSSSHNTARLLVHQHPLSHILQVSADFLQLDRNSDKQPRTNALASGQDIPLKRVNTPALRVFDVSPGVTARCAIRAVRAGRAGRAGPGFGVRPCQTECTRPGSGQVAVPARFVCPPPPLSSLACPSCWTRQCAFPMRAASKKEAEREHARG